jgi:hypothetical protein
MSAAASSSNSSNLREKIAFSFNLTYKVTCETQGTEQEGRSGPEFRYFLEDRKIMWVPPEAHEQIQRATGGEPTGESFEITRRKTGRDSAAWEVVHVADELPDFAPPEALQPRAPARRQATPAPAARPAAQAPAAAPATPPANGPMSATLYTALCAAIRTAAAAEEFARQIGRAVAFEASDIRAMAATLYIQATAGGAK